MPLVAIEGSSVVTGHPCDGATILATPGQTKVKIGGILAARLTDLTESHDILVSGVCIPHTAPVNSASSTVFVEGKAIARLGDGCDAGSIISGNGSNVYAN